MGGNAVIAQSGGPTAVINSSCAGIIQEALKSSSIEQVYGAINGILGMLREKMIDLSRVNAETQSILKTTPSSALGSCRYKLSEKEYDRLLDVIKAHNIRYFFCIGGNDSMDTANKVSILAEKVGYAIRVIGVPKTVDNDLVKTDHCPGYGSIARWWAMAARDAGRDTEAIYTSDPVKILETMGRDSGWITASTALAREKEGDAPHLIYLPERPLIIDRFIEDVRSVYQRKGYCVIAVCEGIKDEKGNTIVESASKLDMDTFGHAQRGGVGDYLSRVIASRLGVKARCDKPGTIQRISGMCVSETDLEEAFMVGEMAVRYSLEGVSGKMVTLKRGMGKKYKCVTGLAPLSEVANLKRNMPDSFINEMGNDVTEEFVKYVMPLIGGPLPPYARLERKFIEQRLGKFE